MSDHLRVGMWLGTENRIKKLDRERTGWRLTDSTGETYYSTRYPEGMRATVEIEPDPKARPMVPWPPMDPIR